MPRARPLDPDPRPSPGLVAAVLLACGSLVLYELLLTRIFAVVLFAQFAHLALALALLGIGVGAVAQHLFPHLVPARGIERRAGWIALLLAAAVVVAVIAALRLPVIPPAPDVPQSYQARSGLRGALLDVRWFSLLLPLLAVPFSLGGLLMSGLLQRLRAHAGPIYAADLVGGALGALAFLPLLTGLSGPDAAFGVSAAACLAALLAFLAARARLGLVLAAVGLLASLGAVAAGRVQGELLPIRASAGFSEAGVVDVRWTPLVRLAVYEIPAGPDGEGQSASPTTKILLDNASASEVVLDVARRDELARQPNRSLVYRIHDPPARVAVLAAAAGPEVAVAQSLGFETVDAIDIASEIFDLVAETWPANPMNPFLKPGVRRIHADGRAAIHQAREPYDIIQMVHANLWSSAGMLASAWSPSLLETREAFVTYLEHLTPDGTLSFGRGPYTRNELKAAVAALRTLGIREARHHVALVEGTSSVLLVKPRPWTRAEGERLRQVVASMPRARLTLDPTDPALDAKTLRTVERGPLMTDDRPYLDAVHHLRNGFTGLFGGFASLEHDTLAVLYRAVAIQVLFVGIAGVLFVLVPFLWRGRSETARLRGTWGFLLYVSGIGYGYLAVETVLIHQWVLFVGHPTYAITDVVLALLLGSGLGSLLSGRIAGRRPVRTLRLALLTLLGLGALLAFGVPPLVEGAALGLPLAGRLILAFLLLLPLGFVMGLPFPVALKALPAEAAGIVPWGWALNGWTSVAASMVTLILARIHGYTVAFTVALAAYALALAVAGRVARVRLMG
ncbi:MAG: hypothetical protein JXB39_02085 [Deltaproteobacteria bacterium]|nr:hypothetical protein [Deltaproteobacteria bacterium]